MHLGPRLKGFRGKRFAIAAAPFHPRPLQTRKTQQEVCVAVLCILGFGQKGFRGNRCTHSTYDLYG